MYMCLYLCIIAPGTNNGVVIHHLIVDEEHHEDRRHKEGAWHRNDQLVAATRGHATSRTHWAAALPNGDMVVVLGLDSFLITKLPRSAPRAYAADA